LLGEQATDEPWVLLVSAGGRRAALAVPEIAGEHDLLRQPLDRALAGNAHLGGSATLDDGRLVLLLALGGLLRRRGGTFVTAARSTPERRRQSVLVVEDSEVIRELVADILRGAGLDVRTAEDGQQAVNALDERVPDVILSDVEMPVMDGFQLLKHVRGRWAQLPVIMLTTRGSDEDRKLAASLGANAHLIKSGFQEELLLETVRRFLDAAP
jgi:CheY-like chemotaxis protein